MNRSDVKSRYQRRRTGRSVSRRWLPPICTSLISLCCVWSSLSPTAFGDDVSPDVSAKAADEFSAGIAPILASRCLNCHNDGDRNGELSLTTETQVRAGGESGAVIVPGDPDGSLLVDMISGDEPEMPQDADPLSKQEIALVRKWIADGAKWPTGFVVEEPQVRGTDWWSLRPIVASALPSLNDQDTAWVRTPIDAFVLDKLRQRGLSPAPPADRRTLVRRLYFDLIGLPPPPNVVEVFVADSDPTAYDRLVQDLLDSPHYGERWARHWLDVVHYGDTHGYDKDKLRPNAWPYRDYVIRSLNENKPYGRFVLEQIAGDVLWPDTVDGIEATGFLAAGPWDFIGHAEVPEEKLDGQVARNLDRDDMVGSTMNTFLSMTVQCARCHNHKFDPVTQEHYYSLQAVFAALDRADRQYDTDPAVAKRRGELTSRQQSLQQRKETLDKKVQELAGDELVQLDQSIAQLNQQKQSGAKPEFGYHSQIVAKQDVVKWVQVDLGESQSLEQIIVVGCHDDTNGIGDGFGFPVRYKIEVSSDPDFQSDTTLVVDHTAADVPNPGVMPQSFSFAATAVRYVRVTATKLAERQNDYIFALGELIALTPDKDNRAIGAEVASLDSIEAPVRWQRKNLVDGYYYGVQADDRIVKQLAEFTERRQALLQRVLDEPLQRELAATNQSLTETTKQLAALPPRQRVYAGTVHHGSGAFKGRGHVGGKPRDVFILVRGEIQKHGPLVGPGTVPIINGSDWRFSLSPDHREGDRRAALAQWIVRPDNPLTWRSIVNRVWQYHFGRGIVASPNDFGRMGQLPSHPELLDWLAVWFRDNGQSLKELHRLVVTSNVYRQAAVGNSDYEKIDADNQYLWRMNRRGLEAEVIRDSVLAVSGKLDSKMYGPGFQDFVLEKPEHSPHYEYHKHDPDDPMSHRRSVYRFLVRSQQQPFMQTLDCADPSQSVAKRETTITAIQALTLLNNKFMVRMAEHFADRLAGEANETREQIAAAYRLALSRDPTDQELADMEEFAHEFGMANVCRVMFNLNEMMFVD